MLANITRLDFRLRLRSTIGYAAGMALYTLIVVALYPAFKNSTSLDSLSGSTAAALFGVTGPLTSPGGWLNGNIYGNFFPLIMLLLTIGYGAAALAGQNEDGTLALITALPVPRRAIVLQKAAAMTAQALLLAAAVTVCVLIGRGFQLTVSPGHAIAIAVALVLMGLDFGLVTMAVGAASGRRGTALGVGAALAAASYLLSSLASTISWIRPGRYLSLFYWSVGNDQISRGVSIGDITALIVAGLAPSPPQSPPSAGLTSASERRRARPVTALAHPRRAAGPRLAPGPADDHAWAVRLMNAVLTEPSSMSASAPWPRERPPAVAHARRQ